MRRISVAVSLVALLALIAAGGARASDNSAVDQYLENLPGAGGGNHPSNGGGSGGGGSGGGPSGSPSTLSNAARHSLQAQGAIGSKAADFAEATAPRAAVRGSGKGAGPGSGGQSQGSAPGADTGSGLGNTVNHAVGGGDPGGMGLAFPIVLGLSLLAALGYVALRWRRRTAAG